jgi:hypothetical protein
MSSNRWDNELRNEHPKIYLFTTILVVVLGLLIAASVFYLAWNFIVATILGGPAISYVVSVVGTVAAFWLNNIRLTFQRSKREQLRSK